ncbi:cytochrome c oxidase subunit 3 [Sinorhizobium alkalisoli]|uniref:NorE accessory protein for nitric oxide reductase n=1 Tax=Sinorhizobium alkalisoli TaxID=1752398 RepID=A0A1E3VGZ2_9HYPH|nr:cytochrome c oxidase subunit 3 [Sinorhizobium alkalisoli]MCA1491321.1 cytochrome c oxidase subunit 3 [Ensifer sp. NBAIM29]MCG5478933.1 cytochrome c oxidase subunit 3 [Sinorhizobium alkalisoli]ODR92860.1 NorE accessory protein for nitric oxide reductase [Sinorhizobium alkalisoli]
MQRAMAAGATGEMGSGEEEEDTLLLWILVWSELAAFGILIGAFLVASVIAPGDFAVARLHLKPGIAAINTLVLLTSGWQAAVAAGKGARLATRRRALVLAALLGFAFVAIKLYEYGTEIRFAGEAEFRSFFELYFILTGFHLVHVAFVGIVLILVAWRPRPANVELVTTLWHVIDLVWIVMFPILYLV